MCLFDLSVEDALIFDLIREMQPRASVTIFEGKIYVYGELLESK